MAAATTAVPAENVILEAEFSFLSAVKSVTVGAGTSAVVVVAAVVVGLTTVALAVP